MKYFKVTAKCGHVGREHYYEGHFFVKAPDAKTAAKYVKRAPRVKKDHGDAILWVKEVDEITYLEGIEAHNNNPYFNCKSKWQQKAVFDFIKDGLKPETNRQNDFRNKKSKYYRDKRIVDKQSNRKGIRNPYKYAKYNTYFIDYELEIV